MKNNNIIFLQEWKERKQASETEKVPGCADADRTFVDLEIFLQKTDKEFNPEYGEDSLSGMLIW